MITDNLFEGKHDPYIFKAIFTAGAPGAGKNFIINKLFLGKGLKFIDSDDLFEFLLKRKGLSLDPDSIASDEGQDIRRKAKDINKRRLSMLGDNRLGLVINGTARNPYLIEEQKERLEFLGYQAAMIFVDVNISTAIHRNNTRKRRLDPRLIRSLYHEVYSNISILKNMFDEDSFFTIDNSTSNVKIHQKESFINAAKGIEKFLRAPLTATAQQWIKNV